MNEKFNKFSALVLSVLLIIGSLSSCSTTPNQKSDNTSSLYSSFESIASLTGDSSDNSQLTSSDENNTTENVSQISNSTPHVAVGSGKAEPVKASGIPSYNGTAFVAINNNKPNFSSAELKTVGYESYSNLDNLGRCGVAIASVGKDTMPKDGEKRGSISSIKPTGWVQAQYDNISGKYLYNRCHLIGWQLSAENANKCNLITGTKYLNIEGMLPFENMVADYIKETNNHVAYRITPVFEGNNLLCSGVQLEAYSVEDDGKGICYNVYCYNVQPGINIDYATGKSSNGSSVPITTPSSTPSSTPSTSSVIPTPTPTPTPTPEPTPTPTPTPSVPNQSDNQSQMVWISRTGSKYHSNQECSNMKNPSQITLEEALRRGLEPCKKCH